MRHVLQFTIHVTRRYAIQCDSMRRVMFIVLALNEKVGFKIPTTRYRKNSILCGALHIGTAKWTSGVRWSFGASNRVARGIKGS